MPNTRSAKKRLRQNVKRRAQNRAQKSALRTQIKKVRSAIEAGNAEQAEAEFRLAATKLDRYGTKGLITKNAAARTKSRLAQRLNVLRQQAASSPGEA